MGFFDFNGDGKHTAEDDFMDFMIFNEIMNENNKDDDDDDDENSEDDDF